jgi:gliding motility-associated-like protein
MKKKRLLFLVFLFLIVQSQATFSQGISVIWRETFNTSPDWTINSDGAVIVPGSTPANGSEPNQWIINNVGSPADLYDGTANLHITCFSLGCDGQPGIPPGGPIYSSIQAANQAAYMNTSIPADSIPAGLTHRLRFYWKCRGGSPATNGSARLIFSVDDGVSWSELSKNYFNNAVFLKDSIEINSTNFPGFVAGVTPIRFGFRWGNALALFGAADPPMIVDNMSIARTIPPQGITVTSITNNPSTGPLNPVEVCPGQSILANFIALGIFPQGTTYTLQLSDPSGIFIGNPTVLGSGTESPISALVPLGIAPGNNYKVRIVSSTSVISTNLLNFKILPTVVPSISLVANPSTGICPGQSVTYSSTLTNGGTNPVYTWFVDNQLVSGATSPDLTFVPTLNQPVKVILTSNARCANPDKDTSETIIVTFASPQPPVSAFLSLPDSNICPGASVTLKAKPYLGGTNPVYRWFRNGNLIVGAVDSVLIFTPANNDKIYLELTSNAPCVSPQTVFSPSTTFRFVPPGNPRISITANDTSICVGDSVTFTATIQDGGPNPVFRWMVNGDTVSTSSSFGTRLLANGDSVRALLVSSLGCAIPKFKISSAIRFTVNSQVTPVLTISSLSENLCSGQILRFKVATQSGGGSGPVYQWFVNGQVQPVLADTLRYLSSIGDTIFSLMTSNSPCATVQSAKSNTVKILTSPQVTLPADTSIEIGNTIRLTGIPPGGQWTGRGIIGNLFLGRNAGIGQDTLRYSITAANGCMSSEIQIITVFKGEQEVFDGFSPNDDGDNDTWKALSDIEDYPNVVVSVYNRYGIEVFRSKRGYPKPWWDGKTVDGKDLPTGAYFFIIEPGQGKETIKGKLKLIR